MQTAEPKVVPMDQFASNESEIERVEETSEQDIINITGEILQSEELKQTHNAMNTRNTEVVGN